MCSDPSRLRSLDILPADVITLTGGEGQIHLAARAARWQSDGLIYDDTRPPTGAEGRVSSYPVSRDCRRSIAADTPTGTLTDMEQPPHPAPTAVDQMSDAYVDEVCRLSPMTAIYLGRGVPEALDDLSPDGHAAQHEAARAARERIAAEQPVSDHDALAQEVICERLGVQIDRFESGWSLADLNVIDSPLQQVRMIFDLLPRETDDDWAAVATLMSAVPDAISGYRQSLAYAAEQGRVPAVRQIDRCVRQCATYAGTLSEPGFFRQLAESAGRDNALGDALAKAGRVADRAYGALGAYLANDLQDLAPEEDAVGEERYRLASRDFLGDTVDLAESYDWGWQEFLAIERELHEVAERIAPGKGPAGAAAALDADPRYQVRGTDRLQAWMQELSDAAIVELGRDHFDIAEPLRTLGCRIAPPGGGVGAYYQGPSDDFARPGSMWFAVEEGREVFSTWRDTTTVYHEGVPGHHLQIATATYRRDTLNAFQRLLATTSGHCEGWALYAERLMRELGYLSEDGTLLGMLDGQLFRAARVIVDIGMHLRLRIPSGTGFHEGEHWTPALGLEFLLTRTVSDPAHCRDEIDRYLGWPGQAPAYKIGEKVWLDGREAAARRHGGAFDLKRFHADALGMGGMGLGPLRRLLATL